MSSRDAGGGGDRGRTSDVERHLQTVYTKTKNTKLVLKISFEKSTKTLDH